MPLTIPRTIHMIWLGQREPVWLRDNLAQAAVMNPGWAVTLWRDRQVTDIVDPRLHSAIARCDTDRRRTNLIRLCLLMKFGGWFLDSDMWCVRPLSEYHDENPKCDETGFGGTPANGAYCMHPHWPLRIPLLEALSYVNHSVEGAAWRAQFDFVNNHPDFHGCIRARKFMLEGLFDARPEETDAYAHFLRHGRLREQDRYFVVHPVRFKPDIS